MYVQGLFDDSADTVEGAAQHRRGRGKAGEVPDELPWPKAQLRQFTLSDSSLGVVAGFDAITGEGGLLVPVEDKHGPAPPAGRQFVVGGHALADVAWDNDQVQLGAQMLLLRANGHACEQGRIYYRKTKSSVVLLLTDSLEWAVRWALDEAARVAEGPMPPPLFDSPKCVRCSLNAICLPDETHLLQGGIGEPRKFIPGRDDAGVLYVTTPGSRIGKTGESLSITLPDGGGDEIPLREVAHLSLYGNSQISTQAMLALVRRGASIAYHSPGGWLEAVTSAPLTKNVHLRAEQYLAFGRQENRLHLARGVVEVKIRNQRTIIRRNGKECAAALESLKELAGQVREADSQERLRGIEGAAGRIYWQAFPALLRPAAGQFVMNGRSRRPPKDAPNAMLSYGYTLLLRDFVVAIQGVGLDPFYGFYHAVEAGRPSLALDLMEAFRPLVVDSVVIRAVNEGVIGGDDFLQVPGCSQLKAGPKKKFIEAYERRVDELVTHPVFEYRLSYRRIFHLEARLLARVLEGELPEYRPLQTR